MPDTRPHGTVSDTPARIEQGWDDGEVYGVSRERIRQIESQAMSKLRHPSRARTLHDYLD